MKKTKSNKLKLAIILTAVVCFAMSYIQSNAMSYMIGDPSIYTWNFDPSSSIQIWTAPESDRYTITMYAGAGSNNGSKTGAKGNYVYALLDLNRGDKLYI